MKIERVKLDSKGRIVLPLSFRNSLSIKENDYVYLSLNPEGNAITISTQPTEGLYELQITMSDVPGTLAKLANVLAKSKVDLISTESHSLERTKNAVWRVVCTFKGDWKKLFKELKQNGAENIQKKKI